MVEQLQSKPQANYGAVEAPPVEAPRRFGRRKAALAAVGAIVLIGACVAVYRGAGAPENASKASQTLLDGEKPWKDFDWGDGPKPHKAFWKHNLTPAPRTTPPPAPSPEGKTPSPTAAGTPAPGVARPGAKTTPGGILAG
mmetsp:Transcript_11079/g.33070  ORF Transcript_11079/g.33070 Transcript_11079/m.33070 type:complete len:140 (+) Transcript_11079:121-540(+)